MATNTVNSVTASTATTLTSNGTTGPYSLDFQYSTVFDVEVFVDGVLKTRTTDYTFTSATQITFTSAPSNGATILIQRNTQVNGLTHFFSDGSVLSATELNNVNKQLLHSIQELVDDYVKRDGSQTINTSLVFEGSTNNDNETTLSITDPTTDRTITFPDITGTVVTTGDTGTVTSAMINDGTIINADINASAAIQGTKISPDFGSQNVTTTGNATVGGTLGVTGNTTLSGTLTVTGAIDANGGAVIDNIRIGITNDNEIDTASGNLTIDSAGGTTTIDDNLTVSGNSTLSGTLGVTGTSTLADVTGGAVITSGTSTSDTKVYSAKRAGEIFYGKGTVAEIQSGETWSSTDDKVATTAAIDARIIDFVDDVGGFDAIANETSFPTTNPQGAAGQAALLSIAAVSTTLTPSSNVITIANGAGTGNTVTINGVTPSTIPQGFGLIVESTSTLHTYNFHRLVPKATEVSTVAGIASNVTTVAGISANVTTVAGISANVTSVAGNASNINTAVSNATNITTVAGSISNVNTVAGSISSVNTASSNISSIANFGDQYQVASSNPSTDGGGNALAAGDLYFNTTANELKVYTGSAWQGGVTASGNFAATTGNNFTGDNVYADNAKAIFGTGQDLKIHHSSNQSTIEEVSGSLNITSNGALSFNPSGSNVVTLVGNSTKGSGQIKLNCEQNSHGIILKGPPHSAAASYTLTLPNSIVTNGVLKTDGSGNTSFALIAGANIADDAVGADQLASNSVVSDSIVDGSIVNADINASAAIAGTKVSPDFGSQDLVTTGNLDLSDSTGAGNNRIRLGTSDDLQIYHDGSESYIEDSGTGSLRVVTDAFQVRNASNTANRLTVASADGQVNIPNNLDVGAGLDVTGDITVTGTVDGADVGAMNTTLAGLSSVNGSLASSVTATTATAGNNSTLVATTAFVQTAVAGIVDSAPAALDTLNELAAALGDDANFATTTANSIGTKFSKAGGDTITGDFTIASGTTNKNVNIDVDSKIRFDDDLKATFGNGDDLQIFHDSTNNNSYIQESGSGNLVIGGDMVNLTNAATTESYIRCTGNAQVELYYNNVKKLQTTANGIKLNDSTRLGIGDNEDFTIEHNGSQNLMIAANAELMFQCNTFNFRNENGSENFIHATENGAVSLYYDNVKTFETTSAGATVTGALTATGNITAFSDKTLKTDINTINDALGTVGKLRGVSYKWKENNEPSIGVIAQEVEQVIPEVVHTSEHNGKEVKSVDYGKMVGVLIEAIKELKAEVEELKGAK